MYNQLGKGETLESLAAIQGGLWDACWFRGVDGKRREPVAVNGGRGGSSQTCEGLRVRIRCR